MLTIIIITTAVLNRVDYFLSPTMRQAIDFLGLRWFMSAFEMCVTCPTRSVKRTRKICARKKQDAGDFVKEKKRKCDKSFKRRRNQLCCFWGREIRDLKAILEESEERVRCLKQTKSFSATRFREIVQEKRKLETQVIKMQ